MTDIALHAHADVGWVSWRVATSFGRIHLERQGHSPDIGLGHGFTLCGLAVPIKGRVVRDQETAAIEDLCKSCLKEHATHH